MNLNELIKEIEPGLKHGLIDTLDPKDYGAYWELTCPQCGKHEAYLYKNSSVIICNRKNHCGHTENILDHLVNQEGLPPIEAIRNILELAGVDGTQGIIEELEREHQRKTWVRSLEAFFQDCLFSKENQTLSYLRDRGYSDEDIKGMKVGHVPSLTQVEEFMNQKSYPQNALRELGFYVKSGEIGKIHTLSIPYRDEEGNPYSFTFRATIDQEKYPKYIVPVGTKKDIPFNLYQAKGEDEVIVVEGLLDALFLPLKGFSPVVATGSATLSNAQLEALRRAGVLSVLLLLDQDPAGRTGTEKAVMKLREEGLGVLVSELPSPYKDPDELLRKENDGINILQECISKAVSWGAFRAQEILKSYDLNTERGREKALSSVGKEMKSLYPQDQEGFLSTIKDSPLMEKEIMEEFLRGAQEKVAREEMGRVYLSTLSELKKGLDQGLPVDPHAINERIRRITLEYQKKLSAPTSPLTERIEKLYQEGETRNPDDLLGYRLNKFKTLAKRIDGVQPGLYIIGAETNVGKTAFLVNLALDLIESNKTTRVIFVALDDPMSTIWTRMMGILSEIHLNEVKKKQTSGNKKETAHEKIQSWINEGRLDILDISQVNHIDQLEGTIRGAPQDGLIVFVDALYNLDVSSPFSGIRELNIERANQVKAMSDSLGIPLIVSGEVRKRGTNEQRKPLTVDDLMETGKLAYNANLVLLLEQVIKDNTPVENTDGSLHLTLNFAKNKLSHWKKKLNLKFDTRTSIMEEQSEN